MKLALRTSGVVYAQGIALGLIVAYLVEAIVNRSLANGLLLIGTSLTINVGALVYRAFKGSRQTSQVSA